MVEKIIEVRDYVTASKLPDSDFVINPYVGCTHGCKYCYASFMKRFTGHQEEWGTFIDVKQCQKPIQLKRLEGKKILLSSVTDCYNEAEEKYEITRGILKQLIPLEAELTIGTKSDLILRDIDLLKQMKNVTVSFSINTLDERFREDMDRAKPIHARIEAMKKLHEAGIRTVTFMSPIFPYITDFKAIVEATKDYADTFWFENLNLRGSYKKVILDYIHENYPQYEAGYKEIYLRKNRHYWEVLSKEIDSYCKQAGIKYINYFYHEEIRKP